MIKPIEAKIRHLETLEAIKIQTLKKRVDNLKNRIYERCKNKETNGI